MLCAAPEESEFTDGKWLWLILAPGTQAVSSLWPLWVLLGNVDLGRSWLRSVAAADMVICSVE